MKSGLLGLALFVAALAVPVLATPPIAKAQGCSLCRDATSGSAPQARKAMRLAIPLLGLPAVGIFSGALILAKRIKPGRGSEE